VAYAENTYDAFYIAVWTSQ